MATLPMMEPSLLSPHSPMRSPRISESGRPHDFSFLLRPDIYHSLNTLAMPAPFKTSAKQPRPDAPVAKLLAAGHFHAAAAAAATELTSGTLDPTNHRRIFELLHIRLTCLVLIDATNVAAQEVKALEDLNNGAVYIDEATGEHVVPWDLRVLNVKLQAVGFGDMRRAVMSYYDLAREARANVAMARHDAETVLWTVRLRDLGVRVAWALLDLDDVVGAITHMQSLPAADDGRAFLAEALLWLHLGDAEAARAAVVRGLAGGNQTQSDAEPAEQAEGNTEPTEGTAQQKQKDTLQRESQVVQALADMADGDFEAARQRFEQLAEADAPETPDETVQVNRAVCLLYTGHMDEASLLLEALIDRSCASRTLLLNLATVYELCTDKNRGLKTALAARVAARDPGEAGWERMNVDFKL